MKKVFTLLLALTMSLAACGGNGVVLLPEDTIYTAENMNDYDF